MVLNTAITNLVNRLATEFNRFTSLSGLPKTATDHGLSAGSRVPDNSTTDQAIRALTPQAGEDWGSAFPASPWPGRYFFRTDLQEPFYFDSIAAEWVPVIVDWCSGYQDFNVTVVAKNCTINRAAAGRYDVTFTRPHPNGADYSVIASGEEDAGNRDNPKVTVVRGSRTANGFRVMVTVDDNGGSADTYVDDEFSFVVKR